MSSLIVDWLGRGGIAQSTLTWAETLAELTAGGRGVVDPGAVTVITRLGREIQTGPTFQVAGVGAGRHPLMDHLQLARHAAVAIRATRPDLVIVQNYVVPPMEMEVARAARAVGARLVVVVHDHRLPPGTAGTRRGLGRILSRADAVVCHSEFVRSAVAGATGRRDIAVAPLVPAQALLQAPPGPPAVAAGEGERLALHFGVVGKTYKGTRRFLDLAADGLPGWRFAVLGAGAPVGAKGVVGVNQFLAIETLVDSLRASRATLLPYSQATQSGAIPLAQACGSVVVASAVGGIPDQVTDGRSGILLPPGAGRGPWTDALKSLSDAETYRALADGARSAIGRKRLEFTRQVGLLAA